MTGEKALHDQFCAWLKRNGYVWRRDRMDKRTTAATGSEPDFWVAKGNRVAMVEMKVGKNRTSPEQDKRFDELAQAGCTVRIARTLEQAVAHIESEFGSGAATEPPAASSAPSRPFLEQEFYWTHSSSLACAVVVAKNRDGHWGAIRIAKPEDLERLARLPQGVDLG